MFSVGGDLAPLLVIYHCVINDPQTWWLVLLTKLLFEQGLVVPGLLCFTWCPLQGESLNHLEALSLVFLTGGPGTAVGAWPVHAAARLPPKSGWVPAVNISRGPSRNCVALYHLALESWTVSCAVVPVPLDSRGNVDTTSTSHCEEVTWEEKILVWPSLQNPCNHTHSRHPVNLPSTTTSKYLLPCIHSLYTAEMGRQAFTYSPLFYSLMLTHTHTHHSQEVSE